MELALKVNALSEIFLAKNLSHLLPKVQVLDTRRFNAFQRQVTTDSFETVTSKIVISLFFIVLATTITLKIVVLFQNLGRVLAN